MARVLFETASTLNGFLADEANSLDWLFAVPSDETPAVAPTATVQVEGSTTYEWALTHEDLIAKPQKWAEYFGTKPTSGSLVAAISQRSSWTREPAMRSRSRSRRRQSRV